jgi:FkbM family methyltransferase
MDPDFAERFASSDSRFAHLAVGFLGLSRSQYFQDVWALFETGFKRDGYFVEIGAYNGVDLSNTYLLEKTFGWSGLLVEPNPEHRASIEASRSAAFSDRCVTGKSGERLSFWVTEASGLSSLASHATRDVHAEWRKKSYREIEVHSISLNDLLEEFKAPPDIAYMSIDTEGNESDILAKFDFRRWRPYCLTIEHNNTHEAAIDEIMLARGYRRRFKELSDCDGWYVACRTQSGPGARTDAAAKASN